MEDPNLNGNNPNTETVEERIARLEEANKKLYARTKTAEGFIQDADGAWVKKAVEVKPSLSEPTKPSDILKADEFKLYRMGYNEVEIDLIMHNGGAKLLEDKTNPIVLGLEASKTQRRAEDAASAASDSSGLSEIERKYTEADLRKMKPDEIASLVGYANQ